MPRIKETAQIQNDSLAKDLQQIVAKSRINNRVGTQRETELLQNLVIYIVDRDHKILEHGIKLGKDQQLAKKTTHSESEIETDKTSARPIL